MAIKTALVPGGMGITGRAIVEHLEGDPQWDVIGLSRRAKPNYATDARFLSVDLHDPADCAAKASELAAVTHVFYCAYAPQSTVEAEIVPNVAMLANLMEALEPVAMGLEHVQLMHGAKWYGSYLGPYKTPAKEDDPRPLVQNLYHAQQDWLVERQAGKPWTWSTLRPHGIWGFAVGARYNWMTGVVLYAAISKHLGLPLRWPGAPGFYNCLYNMIDTGLLAEAMEWAATDPAAANNAYNMNNGDFFRWNQLWPRVAEFFDMEVGPVQTIPLQVVMADKEPVWAEIVAAHGLQPYTLAELTNWDYLDTAMSKPYDQMSSMTKARHAGWHKTLDTETTLVRQMQRVRDEKIIP